MSASALRYYEQRAPDPIRAHATAASGASTATCCGRSRSCASRSASVSRSTRSATALATLPDGADADPGRLGTAVSLVATRGSTSQIAVLERLRDELTSCIGCGCLSLRACALYNRGDAAAALGSGPRYLLGDTFRTS